MMILAALRTAVAVLVIPPLMRIMPLDRLALWLGRRVGRQPWDEARQARVARWVDGALRRLPPPWRRTCLTRSAVLYHLLRSGGIPVELRIGVQKRDGVLEAHAWLEAPSSPVPFSTAVEKGNEHDGEFQEIARFPQAPTPPAASSSS